MHLAIQTREVVGGCQGDARYRAETAPERSTSRGGHTVCRLAVENHADQTGP